MVGGTWWVGAHPAKAGTAALLRAVDPTTLAPAGEPIRVDSATATTYGFVDASGTPMLYGDLQIEGGLTRPMFVPIDVKARAACDPTTLTVSTNRSQYQAVRAIQFHGDTAGAVVDVWAGTPPTRRMFFTRLRCHTGGT
jgi:hypothetical protein